LYLYLHGFASGPESRKAQYFHQQFQALGYPLTVPDFNQGGFASFTISRQLHQTQTAIEDSSACTLIGSSLGGWAALLLAQQYPHIERLILLAPALGFPQGWLDRLGPDRLAQWQQQGSWPVYHYGAQREIPLHYQFVTDAQQYRYQSLDRQLPTLICHGRRDEVVPLDLSRAYAAHHPAVQLLELDSDHSLTDVLPEIWQAICAFAQITSPS
jgi:uncharacterized protein